MEQGKLYLCATPIGNLEDITLRVIRTLKEVDLIAAEDTRNSLRLLNHFDIHTPMTSYHEYNKIEKAHTLIAKMREGKNVALITDAGMPGISDPGEELVRLCREAGVEVTVLPGACACVTALTLRRFFRLIKRSAARRWRSCARRRGRSCSTRRRTGCCARWENFWKRWATGGRPSAGS